MAMVNDSSIGISVQLEMDNAEYRSEDKQFLKFTLINNSDTRVNLLKWLTPFEGIRHNMFKISHEDKSAVYLGILVKRGIPTPDHYLTLDPKSSLSTNVEITEFYDISETGEYKVEYISPLLDVGKENPITLSKNLEKKRKFLNLHVPSNVTGFKLVENRKPKQIDGVMLDFISKHEDKNNEFVAPTFNANCTLSEQNTIPGVLAVSEHISTAASLALHNRPNKSNYNRYIEWFGGFDNTRYNTATSNLESISAAIINQTITFNCHGPKCDSGDFAYVFPSKPYEIFLCGGFWAATLTGTDSQSGTIVHEMSHFNVVAGTDDNAYGQANCKSLAINDPAEAIENADSHEYFAENNPPLSVTKSLQTFASERGVNKPFSVINLLDILRVPANQRNSLLQVMSS